MLTRRANLKRVILILPAASARNRMLQGQHALGSTFRASMLCSLNVDIRPAPQHHATTGVPEEAVLLHHPSSTKCGPSETASREQSTQVARQHQQKERRARTLRHHPVLYSKLGRLKPHSGLDVSCIWILPKRLFCLEGIAFTNHSPVIAQDG